jgi:hypothetical protein
MLTEAPLTLVGWQGRCPVPDPLLAMTSTPPGGTEGA